MRGWFYSAALFVLLLTVPVWAQRGGGGHGGMGGGHVGGGFSGGAHAGAYAGYHGGTAYRGGYAGYRGGNWSAGSRAWGGTTWRGNNWNGRGWYGRGWYRTRWGWNWGYPYWGVGWGWYPGWGWGYYGDTGWDNSYSYSPDMSTYAAAPTYASSYPSIVYMAPDGSLQDSPSDETQQQINQLQQQVSQLQAEQQKSSSPRMTDVHYDTVLVYRDGHTETVGNYAIVGNTVWVFNETRARKIPLSELDLRATKRSNQDRGNDFVVPGSR